MLCVCVCVPGRVRICMWICAVPCGFSAATVWSDLPTEHHHTANTHTHTHIHVDQKYSDFFFKPMPAPGQDGWHVCEARLFRTCRPCKSLPGAGLHVEIPKRRGLGHASVLITRVHICRGCTQITPTRILRIICYQASLSLPTCHSNTHALSPCIRWRPAWQEKKGASRGNPEAVRSITQQH